MLIRSTWTIQPKTDAVLPRSMGLAFASELHDKMGIEMGDETFPSVTFSGVLGPVSATSDFLTLSAQNTYQIALCGLQPQSVDAIASLDLKPRFTLLGHTFEVQSHQYNQTSYEDLYQHWVASDAAPVTRHRLKFLSPTAFKQEQQVLPLPIPRLLFRSWLKRWNHFSTIYLGDEELLDYLSEAIALRHHSIKTRSVTIQRGVLTGFLGEITLQTYRRTDPLLANVASLLIHYGEYAGTGAKTRLGMGFMQRQLDNIESENSHLNRGGKGS